MSKRSNGRPLWREENLHIWRFRWLIGWLMQDGRAFYWILLTQDEDPWLVALCAHGKEFFSLKDMGNFLKNEQHLPPQTLFFSAVLVNYSS
jgi:hypothetical protein